MEYHCFSLIQVIKLLCSTPKIHTLKLDSISIDNGEFTFTEQNQSFRYVSNSNIIRNIILQEKCSLEKVKILRALCPHLENLTIGIDRKNLSSIIEFLLSPSNARQLHLLCTSGVSRSCLEEIKKLINLEKHDYSIKFINNKLYIWW